MSDRLSLTARSILVAAFLALVVWPAAQKSTHGFATYYTASRLFLTEGVDAHIYDAEWFRERTEIETEGKASDIFNVNQDKRRVIRGNLGSENGDEDQRPKYRHPNQGVPLLKKSPEG